jgi:hypothetical protein
VKVIAEMRAILNFTLGVGGALLLAAASARAADVVDLPLKVTHAKGDVTDHTGRLLKNGDRLKTGDTIRTGRDSWAALVWVAEGTPKGKGLTHSLVRVEPSSELAVTKLVEALNEPGDTAEPYRVIKMDLKSGSLAAIIKKNPSSKVEFKTVNTVADTRGAMFRLNASGTSVVLSGEIMSKVNLPGGRAVRITTTPGQELKLTSKILSELENGSLSTEELRALAPASTEELNKLVGRLTAAAGTAVDAHVDVPQIVTAAKAAAIKKKKKKRK